MGGLGVSWSFRVRPRTLVYLPRRQHGFLRFSAPARDCREMGVGGDPGRFRAVGLTSQIKDLTKPRRLGIGVGFDQLVESWLGDPEAAV